MKRLDGRTAIVMGAGAVAPGWSNGKACAYAYAEQGASVVCVDFVLERAEETARLIRDAGGRALALQADATDEANVQQAVDRTLEAFGRLDILHNNVGMGGSSGAPDQIAPADWAREINQNLTSAYLGIRCAAPVMRAAGGGAIINISSLLALRFMKRPSVAYATAKAGVETLTEACAAAYGRDNIRVNCIRIGFSETPVVMQSLAGQDAAEREAQLNKTRAKVPLRGEHGHPADVGEAAVFLASDAARHITGVILNVDGGLAVAPI